MAPALASACVATSCCSLTNAREGYGRHSQQQQAAATSLTTRSAFCGQKLAASLKAQKWLPQAAPTQRRRVAKGARLQVSSVLVELDQTVVRHYLMNSSFGHVRVLHNPRWGMKLSRGGVAFRFVIRSLPSGLFLIRMSPFVR